MNKILLSVFLLLLASPHFTFSQDFEKQKLDAYLDSLEVHDKFMGSVAVSKDGRLIYSKSVGYADVESKVLADAKSKYRIGSISKTFTATLIMKVIEEGKLTLNQKLSDFYPQIEDADSISIKNLLQHRSGIPNYSADTSYFDWHTKEISKQDLIKKISSRGSDFDPGETSEYSNSNYALLTFILTDATGESYQHLLEKYITKPVGLQDTYLGGKINTKNHECNSYEYDNGWKISEETHPTVFLGAGGVVSTPTDLVQFLDALMSGKVVNEHSLSLMKSVEGKFGLGLIPLPFYDQRGYGHTGGVDGFRSILVQFADGPISYSFTSNGANMNTNDVSLTVLKAVYGKPFEIPSFEEYGVDPEILKSYEGVYKSDKIPLDFTITTKENQLYAQLKGQPQFPLEATSEDSFKFEMAGVEIKFDTEKNTLTLFQGGQEIVFEKE